MDDPDRLKRLISVPSEVEATAIVAALAAHEIEAKATGGFTSAFKAEAPGMVHVMVRQEDLEAARAALDEIRKRSSDADWSQFDLGEPG
jgi:hypothetical protein